MKKIFLLTPLFLFCIALTAQDISLQNFASGFSRPLDITHCGDDRMFVTEQAGRIKIVQPDGTVLGTPFLNIASGVNSNGNEQGLLGLAFHPDYLNNGYFYVNYTIGGSNNSRVSRFSVSPTDPNLADMSSEMVLFQLSQPFTNHNGGCIKFGPDGYLYISFGDGGSGGDPQANGQKRTTMLGKMLRIDVDGASPYGIPADNPFVNDSSTLDEIWALGLRNAWRFSFDRVSGDLWMGDVGQNAWEEINFQPANSTGGENYGWRCYEGDVIYNANNCPPMSELTFPVMVFPNSSASGNCSVTGGFVYRGCEFPALYGHYLFTDYCSGRIWRTTPDGNGGWESVELANLNNNQFVSLGENAAGQLFVAALGSGQILKMTTTASMLSATDETCAGDADGSISFTIPTDQFGSVVWSDGPTDANRTDLAPGDYDVTVTTTNGCVFQESITVGEGTSIVPPTISLSMDSILSADPAADTYQWLLNGVPIPGADEATYTAQEDGDYSVVITNDNCEATSTELTVVLTSGVLETLGLSQFSLTPNPFGNSLTLQVFASQNLDLEMLMTDLQGKTFLRQQANVNGGYAKTFDLTALPAGVYFFKMKTQNGEWSERVVKK